MFPVSSKFYEKKNISLDSLNSLILTYLIQGLESEGPTFS